MSRQNEIEKLIAAHRRRLHILQEKQAQYGLETPPSILIEIADIESEIGNLQIELEQLKPESNEKTPVENIVGSPLQGQFVKLGKAGLVVLFLLAFGLLVYFFVRSQVALTPANLATSIPDILTVNVDAAPTVYDNFNNPAFDGSYNQDQWRTSNISTGQISQQDGILIMSKEGELDSVELIAKKYEEVILNDPTFFEAKLMLDPHKHAGQIQLGIGVSLSREVTWLSQCSISENFTNDGTSWANCFDQIYPAQGGSFYDVGVIPFDYGTWHNFRIELDPETTTLAYYIDGQMVGSHIPVDAEKLQDAKFWFNLSIWSDQEEPLTGYVDDVRIGRVER